MARKDIHRPSVIKPEDYTFVAYGYMGSSTDIDIDLIVAERAKLEAHKQRTGGAVSRHAHGGNCHICGAQCIYTAYFYHAPTNTYILTGLDCAEKLDMQGAEGFRRQVTDALQRKAGKEKAQALLVTYGLGEAWEVYKGNGEGKEEGTVFNIVSQLITYGQLSEAQYKYLGVLLERIDTRAQREAQWAADNAAAAPLPITDARIRITGTVLSVKVNEYTGAYKILVKSDEGWKVYGSRPKAIDVCKYGDRVVFEAYVKPSEKDTKFGFFTRPTKAKFLA